MTRPVSGMSSGRKKGVHCQAPQLESAPHPGISETAQQRERALPLVDSCLGVCQAAGVGSGVVIAGLPGSTPRSSFLRPLLVAQSCIGRSISFFLSGNSRRRIFLSSGHGAAVPASFIGLFLQGRRRWSRYRPLISSNCRFGELADRSFRLQHII